MNSDQKTQRISIKISLPPGFWKMPPEEMARQYPIKAQMPQEAYYSEDGKAILSINHRPDKFKVGQIPQFKEKVFDQSVSRAHPDYTSRIVNINNAPCILMSYRADLEEPLYIVSLVTSHQGRMLALSFSCPFIDKETWLTTIKQTYQSLKIKP